MLFRKILLSSTVLAASTFGVAGVAGAVDNSAASVGGRGLVGAGALNYECAGLICSCAGDIDCNKMFDELDCIIDVVDESTGVPIGHCIGPHTRASKAPNVVIQHPNQILENAPAAAANSKAPPKAQATPAKSSQARPAAKAQAAKKAKAKVGRNQDRPAVVRVRAQKPGAGTLVVRVTR